MFADIFYLFTDNYLEDQNCLQIFHLPVSFRRFQHTGVSARLFSGEAISCLYLRRCDPDNQEVPVQQGQVPAGVFGGPGQTVQGGGGTALLHTVSSWSKYPYRGRSKVVIIYLLLSLCTLNNEDKLQTTVHNWRPTHNQLSTRRPIIITI